MYDIVTVFNLMAEESQNLSEILFKPKFVYKETSTISNGGCPLPRIIKQDKSFGFSKNFYRPLLRYEWVLSGGNALDIDEALSNISVAKGHRTRECFDTVEEYGPGNWIYEFSSIAQKRVNLAHENEANREYDKASHNYRLASRYFAIASYPNLKGDTLALQADTLSRSTYKQMFKVDNSLGYIKEETFKVDSKDVKGYLHLPSYNGVFPCVICVCNYEFGPTSFFRMYNNFFKKEKIAIFVVELPGTGECEKLTLSEHLSAVTESAIDHVKKLNNVDSSKIVLLGSRLAATSCLRASVLKRDDIKALCVVFPYIHSVFTDASLLKSFPLCLRSSLCNRLNLDASSWDTVIPQLKALSLKEQGLIGAGAKCYFDTYVGFARNSVVSKQDELLLSMTFEHLQIDEYENGVADITDKIMFDRICQFLKKQLCE